MSRPEIGGTFQYTLSTIEALRRIPANRYTIFTPASNHSYDSLGLPVRRLPSAGRTVIELLRAKFTPGKKGHLFSEVDKVIAPIYTTRLLASRRPFLFTLHDLQERYYPENFTFAQRLWRGFVNKSLSSAAAGIICESSYVKRDISAFLAVSESKIDVIPAPPLSAFFAENLRSAAFRRAVDAASLPARYLFYPAQFFPHKNHIRLVEAFSRVLKAYPDCRLLLTGKKKYDYAKVMARVSELGIDDRVQHLGYVNIDDLAVIYLKATVVVIPTLFESISIPVYEAFRMGTAVCASNVVALPEQIGDAGILFDPLSIEDMAEKISSLLGDESLRKELGRRATQRVSTLTIDRYSRELAAALDRIGDLR